MGDQYRRNQPYLHIFFLKSYRTNFVLMSATPSDEIIDYFNANENAKQYVDKRKTQFDKIKNIILGGK